MGNIPSIKIDAAPGELIDKITILEIKAELINDAMKCANVTYELATLTNALNLAVETSEQISDLSTRLKAVNERLWETEDSIRHVKTGRISSRSLSTSHALSTAWMTSARTSNDRSICCLVHGSSKKKPTRITDQRRRAATLICDGADTLCQPALGSSFSDAEFMQ